MQKKGKQNKSGKQKMIIAVLLVAAAVILVGLLMKLSDLQKKREGKSVPAFHETTKQDPEDQTEYDGKNKVDYSVMDGTVTTVSEKTPGQAYCKSKKQFDSFEGKCITINLPEGVKAGELTFQDDYMKKKLSIHFPAKYQDALEALQNGLKSDTLKTVKTKNGQDKASLVLKFKKTMAFHYYIKDDVLTVKYGAPSLYYDKLVVFDPGHGGRDDGGYVAGISYSEKQIINAMMDKLYNNYRNQTDVMAYFTRTTDVNYSLSDRIALANEIGADLFISFHTNLLEQWKGAAYGVEVCYNQNDKSKPYNSKWLAKKFQDAYPEAMGLFSRGLLKDGDLKVLRLSNMPACLVEMGFITNSGDLSVLADEKMQQVSADTFERVVKEALEEMKHE